MAAPLPFADTNLIKGAIFLMPAGGGEARRLMNDQKALPGWPGQRTVAKSCSQPIEWDDFSCGG
jgi:hypothetical protein